MNKHIEKYCREFMNRKENPRFAIFIKGKWGVGKTHFMNKLIESLPTKESDSKKITQDKVLKISLFGVRNAEDIDAKIYQAMHPILSSKGAQLVGAVFRSMLKLGTKFDFNNDGKTDLSISLNNLMPLEGGKEVRKIKYRVLIVDDFERADMVPSSIFGYFSQIVTDSDTRVIFVGNEEKVRGANNSQTNENESLCYDLIKEKTIGAEFMISAEVGDAVNAFIEEIGFGNKDEFIKNQIIEIARNLKCENLRVLRQCLYNLKMFLSNLDVVNDKSDYEKTIGCFILLFIQKSLNYIGKKDCIATIIRVYQERQVSYYEYKKDNNSSDDIMPELDVCYIGYTPFFEYWSDIIFNGNYDHVVLNAKYAEEKSEHSECTQLFTLLNSWRDLNKEDFKNAIQKVQQEFEDGIYLHPGEIMHYADLLICFAKWGLISDSIKTVIAQVQSVVEKYKTRLVIVQEGVDHLDAYGGFVYSDNEELKEIRSQLENLNNNLVEKQLAEEIKEKVDKIGQDVTGFIEFIENRFYCRPFLSLIDIEKFYSKLQELSPNKQHSVIYAFQKRYGTIYLNKPYKSEYSADYDNLNKLYELYKGDDEDLLYNPCKLFKVNAAKRLLEIVDHFEQNLRLAKNKHEDLETQRKRS